MLYYFCVNCIHMFTKQPESWTETTEYNGLNIWNSTASERFGDIIVSFVIWVVDFFVWTRDVFYFIYSFVVWTPSEILFFEYCIKCFQSMSPFSLLYLPFAFYIVPCRYQYLFWIRSTNIFPSRYEPFIFKN